MSMRRKDGLLSAIEREARHGNGSAAFVLGRIYDEGWGVKRSARRAMRGYQSAARDGATQAYYFVGSGYAFGEGVLRDEREAFRWFSKAAAAGDLTGAYMMAVAVLEGTGTRRDKAKGMRLLLRAARSGSRDAMDYLAARHFEAGRRQLARSWATKAARLGDEVAVLRLREINPTDHLSRRR